MEMDPQLQGLNPQLQGVDPQVQGVDPLNHLKPGKERRRELIRLESSGGLVSGSSCKTLNKLKHILGLLEKRGLPTVTVLFSLCYLLLGLMARNDVYIF